MIASVIRALIHWASVPASPLEFWMPQSGLLGGAILATLIFYGFVVFTVAIGGAL